MTKEQLQNIILELEQKNAALQAANDGLRQREKLLHSKEQKQTDESKYEALVSHYPHPIFLTVPDGTILNANKAACKLFGYSEDEFRQVGRQGILDHTGGSLLEQLKQREEKGYVTGEVTGIKKNGERFLCEISSVIFKDEKGEERTSTRLVDISERRNQEEGIQHLLTETTEARTILKNVLDSISDGFVALDKQWQCTYVNVKGALLLNGRLPGELIGKHALTAFPEGLNQSFLDACEKVMKERTPVITQEYYEPWKKFFENRIYPAPNEGITIFYRDITDQKKTDDALKKSELRFRSLIEKGSEIIALHDSEGKTLYLSPSIQTILGYSPEERIGRSAFDNIHPEDAPALKIKLAEIVANPESFSKTQWRHRHADGSWHWMEGTATNLLNDPAVNAVVHNFRDITIQKKAENQILREKEFSESIIKSLPGIFYLYDMEGRALRWNRNFETISGYSSEEIRNMYPIDFFDDDEKRSIMESIGKAFEAGEADVQAHFVTKEGKKIPYYFCGSAIELDGEPCLIGTAIDMTEREKVEEAVKDSEEKRRLIMNAALDAIICIDTRGTITFWNPQAEKIFGWKGEEVMGEVLSNIIIPEPYRQMHNKGIENYLRTGKGPALNILLELSAVNRDGKIFPVELTVLPIKQGGEEFFCAFIRDITKRKTIEDAIRASKERYDIVTKATNDSIWDWDLLTNNVVRDNKKLETQFGYEGWEGTDVDYHWNRLAHPEDWARVTKQRNAILKNPKKNYWEDEYRFLKTNGEYAYIYDRGYILRDEKGKPVRMIGASQDISERKLAEEAIKTERNLLRTLINNMPDAVYVKDLEGRKLLSNKVDLALMGAGSEADIIGKTDLELYPNAFGATAYEIDMGVIRSGKPHLKQEEKFVTNDGTQVWLLTTKVPLRNDNGEIIGLVGVGTDIANLKRIEAELLLSAEKYRLLFYLSPLPKLIFDIETNEVLDVNNAAINQYGYSHVEFVNITLQDIMAGVNMQDKILMAKEKAQNKSVLQLGVWDHVKKNGERIKVEMTGHPIEYNENDGMIVVCDDVTEKLAFQQALIQSNERFEYATKATSDAIWDWDLLKESRYWSMGFEHIFGYKLTVLRSDITSWTDHIHPEDIDRVLKGITEAINGNETNWADEYRYLKNDQTYAYVADRGFVIRDAQGKATRMVGAMQDITERKQGEEHLKLLESVITNATDSILITEAETIDGAGPRIIYVNDAFTKMTGYRSDEVIGKTPRILQGPKTDRKELNVLRKALEKRIPYKTEVINYKKNGEEFWINMSISPVSDAAGRLTHFIAVERDLTQRKTEELQKNLLAEISQLFNSARSLQEILGKVLDKIASFGDFNFAEAWLIGTDESQIKRAATYSQTDQIKLFFNETADVRSFVRGEGLVGTVWEAKTLQFWRDIDTRKDFIRWEAARKIGLKTAYGLPLLYNEEIIGVLILALARNEEIPAVLMALFESLATYIGTEIKRKQLEQDLNQIFNFAPDIISIAGLDGYFKKINPAACELLEYTEEELMAVPFANFIHQEDKGQTADDAKSLGESNAALYSENRFITKSGKIKWLAWTSTPSPEEGLIFGVAKDITEKKELQNLLNKTTSLARIGGWELDMVKNTLYWSDISREIHEVGPDFELDMETSMGFYKEGNNRALIIQKIQEVIKKCLAFDVELQIITAKNNEKWIRIIGESESVDGKCIRIYGSFQDIDSRKRAELAVTEVLEEKNIILESIGDAFFAVDKNWTVTYWNNQAERMLQVPKSKIVGHHLWEVFSDSIDSESYKRYHQAIETQHIIHFEDYYGPVNAWFEISAYPSENGLSVYFKDVTERKMAEEALKEKNKELKKLSAYLQNVREEERKYIAREVHDELGQLASALKIDIDWLDIKIASLEENAKKRIAHANKTIEVLILSIRKIASSLRPSVLDDFGLNAALKWHCAEFQNLNGIPCTFEPGFDDKTLGMEMKTELYRMAQESLTNVMRHAKASYVTVSTQEDADHYYLTVTDNGKGFDTTQRKSTLGLIGLRERALSLNGVLQIESTIGTGTVISAVIPKK